MNKFEYAFKNMSNEDKRKCIEICTSIKKSKDVHKRDEIKRLNNFIDRWYKHGRTKEN